MARASRKITQTFNGAVLWEMGGGYFKLLATVSAVTVRLYLGGQIVLEAESVEGGFYQRVRYDRIEIVTGASESVSFLAADDEGGSDSFTGTFTAANLRGSTLANETAATVGTTAASVLAANAGRKFLIFRARSTNTDDICLGASGVTMSGALRLSPGESFDASSMAPAQWFAIAGAAGQGLDIVSGA